MRSPKKEEVPEQQAGKGSYHSARLARSQSGSEPRGAEASGPLDRPAQQQPCALGGSRRHQTAPTLPLGTYCTLPAAAAAAIAAPAGPAATAVAAGAPASSPPGGAGLRWSLTNTNGVLCKRRAAERCMPGHSKGYDESPLSQCQLPAGAVQAGHPWLPEDEPAQSSTCTCQRSPGLLRAPIRAAA